MDGWTVKTLGQVCTFKPPKGEARVKLSDDDEVSFAPMEDLGIGVKYLQPHRTRKLGEVSGSYTYFADGDVLLAKITPCFENGKLGVARDLTNGAGFGSSEYIVLRPTASLDAEFLYYYLARPVFLEEGARHMAGAVGHKRVTKEFVESYPIPLPPLPEQRRIVAILDEAFEGIATVKANAEKNLLNARTLFESHLQSVFTERGDGWVEQRLGELYQVGSSKRVLKSQWTTAGVPFYRGREITRLAADGYVNNELFISEDLYAELSSQSGVPATGDIVITAIGTIGNAHIVRDCDRFYFKDASVLWMRRVAEVSSEFINYWLKSPSFFDQLDKGNGATVDTLTIQKLQSVSLPIPPIAVQKQIASELAAIREETLRLESIYQQKLNALGDLKKSLLHQAFSGQL